MPRHFAVLPAAGASVRMGTPKLLLPWGKQCLLDHVLAIWTSAGLDGIAIVLPPDQPEFLRRARTFNVESIVPVTRPADMKASVRLGLARLCERFQPLPADAWLLAPADLPGMTAKVIQAVVAAYDATPEQIVVPVHEGRRTHPVALPWTSVRQIDELPSNEGIDTIVKTGPVRELPVDASFVLDDLDTPEDYARLHDRYVRRNAT